MDKYQEIKEAFELLRDEDNAKKIHHICVISSSIMASRHLKERQSIIHSQ